MIPNNERRCMYDESKICNKDCIAYNDWEYTNIVGCQRAVKTIKISAEEIDKRYKKSIYERKDGLIQPWQERRCMFNKERICNNGCMGFDDWGHDDHINCLRATIMIKGLITDEVK